MAKTTRSSPPSAAQKRLAAERAAAARERIQVAQRRRRLIVVAAAVGVVVVLVAALLIAKAALGGDGPKSGKRATAAQTSVTTKIADVPLSVFNTVGTGGGTASPSGTTTGLPPSGGKPTVFYAGAEFCPYCAAERWPLTVALSRFGTFHNLGQVRSSPSDTNPNTATLSYHGATYSSPYLTFVGKELQSNQVNSAGTNYATLDTLTGPQQALFAKVKGYPYLNIAGKYVLNQAQYDGSVLAGKDQQQIATALSDPNSAIAKGVIGSANRLTAALCQVTGGKPGTVCSSAGVKAARG